MIEPLIFLWPAFLVAVALVGIHAYFGIQVLARKVIFVDLALAQIAALGTTVAFMLGHSAQSGATYGYSLAFTLLAAVLLAFTRTLRGSAQRRVTLEGQRFDPEDREARLYATFFCRNCGQEHHPVVLAAEDGVHRVLPRDIDETPLDDNTDERVVQAIL
jgi:hypothetical protein